MKHRNQILAIISVGLFVLSAVRNGNAPNKQLREPMLKFKLLTDKQVGSIYEYLRSLPAVNNNN